MGKNGGNIIIALLLCMVQHAWADIVLRAQTMRGQQIDAVSIGEPFVIEISVQDMAVNTLPKLYADSALVIDRQEQRMHITINGQSTNRFRYIVHMNAIGKHTLGPAVIEDNGTTINSNTVVIEVDEKSLEDTQKKEAFARFEVDKERVVVNEQINCMLTFYYGHDTIEPKFVEEPRFNNAKVIGTVQDYTTGSEKINGSRYYYIRWQWQLYPKVSGTLIIPARRVEYDVEMPQGYGPFSFFRRAERKRIYSNALQIEVMPLPPHTEDICAVGHFKHIYAEINPTVAKEGEAMVLTLAFEGSGDLEALAMPKLEGMPDALRYYDSKNYIEASNYDGMQIKKFEYVVQGRQAGIWEIPAQTYIYFDVQSGAYKTVHTTPLGITILANPAQQVAPSPTIALEQGQIEQELIDDVLPIDTSDAWYPVHARSPLPWWLFIMLILLPWIYLSIVLIRVIIARHYAQRAHIIRAHAAFKTAKDALYKAQQAHNTAHVYEIVIQLFADRCMVPQAQITQNFIIQQLRKGGLSAHSIAQWDDFFAHISMAKFDKINRTQNTIFGDVYKWLILLEEII